MNTVTQLLEDIVSNIKEIKVQFDDINSDKDGYVVTKDFYKEISNLYQKDFFEHHKCELIHIDYPSKFNISNPDIWKFKEPVKNVSGFMFHKGLFHDIGYSVFNGESGKTLGGFLVVRMWEDSQNLKAFDYYIIQGNVINRSKSKFSKLLSNSENLHEQWSFIMQDNSVVDFLVSREDYGRVELLTHKLKKKCLGNSFNIKLGEFIESRFNDKLSCLCSVVKTFVNK